LKTILVPLSSHEKGISTLQYVFDFAAYFSSEIVILKSFGITTLTESTPQIDAVLKKDCLKELQEILASINTHGLNYSIKIIKGKLIETCEEYLTENDVDLIISKPKKTKKDKDLFIGRLSGKMIKQLDCPILLIPRNYVFKPFEKGLLAIKSGILKKEDVLTPLSQIKAAFKTDIHLLQVKTPKLKEQDFIIHQDFLEVKDSLHITENETIFLGAEAYYSEIKPDFLCVIRRKFGFFSKLWNKNTVKKSNFKSEVPVLVLKGSF
jgi:nucleotide-binding universal stress UspA family protein